MFTHGAFSVYPGVWLYALMLCWGAEQVMDWTGLPGGYMQEPLSLLLLLLFVEWSEITVTVSYHLYWLIWNAIINDLS